MMHAQTRLFAVLAASFVLWLPALVATMSGDLDADAAGIRFSAALAAAWVFVAGLHRVIGGYSELIAAEDPATAANESSVPDRRRAGDRTPSSDEPETPDRIE